MEFPEVATGGVLKEKVFLKFCKISKNTFFRTPLRGDCF